MKKLWRPPGSVGDSVLLVHRCKANGQRDTTAGVALYILGQGILEKIYYPRFDIPQVMIWDFNWLK